jgi:hypothetical protein
MINGYLSLNTKDIEKFEELKRSPMYGDYLQTIVKSPILNKIVQDHIEDLNIASDIKKLKAVNASDNDFSIIFKDALLKTANRIVADTIILKELSDIGIQDVKNDLTDSFTIKYLIGLADEKWYKEAEKLLDTKEPDTSSVLYQGLVQYYRKNKRFSNSGDIGKIAQKRAKKIQKTKVKKKIPSSGFSSSIDLDNL